jgi:ERCC4-type nuclease
MTVFEPLEPLLKVVRLRDQPPIIIFDSREQQVLPIRRLPKREGTLYSGDYSVAGLESLFAIERKSVPDLVSCCIGAERERFERELHRLRGFQFKRLLVVGRKADVIAHRYRSNVAPKVVLHSLAAWEIRYDIPVVWVSTPEAAATRLESWAWWFAREVVQNINALARAQTPSHP